ncbi:DUF6471 domain-containing protein [Ralstonia pseudosolanacearum]|uniref:DUF6471 domain-containing protein n=1 Tax=Ralstonia pseudosolanacearum TaxID=1310165 RepID=UPI003AAFA305
MSHVETPWTRLASRTLRGLLIRKGATYSSVAEHLRDCGIDETTRSVEGKATRGTYSLAFFLNVLNALNAEHPPHWGRAIGRGADAQRCATHILLLELKRCGIDLAMLSRQLTKVGLSATPESLVALVETGTFPFTLLLQIASANRLNGLERYVDQCDIIAAAAESKRSDFG